MNNPYKPPAANLDRGSYQGDFRNNSGEGRDAVPPPGVKGWSWGAFMFNWIWAVGNKTWIGLLSIVPYIGFIVAVYLGIKGRELAWQNKRWDSLEHFQRVQRRWSIWSGVLMLVAFIGILAAVILPAIAHR